jgi:hypothetical protein
VTFLALFLDPRWIGTLTGLDPDAVGNGALEWLLPVGLLVVALIPPRSREESPTRLAVGVLLGVIVWLASAYGMSRLVGANNFAQSFNDIARGYDSQWWWAGAVAGVVTAVVEAGARRTAAAAVAAGLTLGAGLLAWQVVWAFVSGME